MDPSQTRAAVKNTTQAYLGSLRHQIPEFGSSCNVAEGYVLAWGIPNEFKEIDSGYLEIDGTKKGAEIFIDGVKKGKIRQKFVVSVGTHKWKAMKCEETVYVNANEEIYRRCDK